MKSTVRIDSNEIAVFSATSFYDRTRVCLPAHQTVLLPSKGNEIFRLVHSNGRTYVSVQEPHIPMVQEYVHRNDLVEKLRSPTLYREILHLLGYDPCDFLLEPSEEFLQDIQYNCVHMLDYVCAKETFAPQCTDPVETICRGDERFLPEKGFDDVMYCITDRGRVISFSYYKPNRGKYENTCSMQVFSRPQFRGRGYAKMTASAATQAVVQENRLALWACQVENLPSRSIAETLGYRLLGGELRIVK